MLELYQFEECEYSAQVRPKMSEWGIDDRKIVEHPRRYHRGKKRVS